MATYKLKPSVMSGSPSFTEIKSPTEFNIEKYTITKAGRVANGEMTMEYITRKRKFLFSYKVIGSDEKEIIEGLLFAGDSQMFFILSYEEDGVVKEAKVYPGAIKGKKQREGKIWYWLDYGFDLIEV